jgi:hypothetical protein
VVHVKLDRNERLRGFFTKVSSVAVYKSLTVTSKSKSKNTIENIVVTGIKQRAAQNVTEYIMLNFMAFPSVIEF